MNSIFSTRALTGNVVFTTRHFKNKALKIQTLISYNGKEINVDELVSNGNLKEITEELGNAINEHTTKLNEFNDAMIQIDNRVKVLESTKTLHETKITSLEQRIDNIQTNGSGCDCDLTTIQENITSLDNRVNALETNGSGCDCDLTTIQEDITALQTQNDYPEEGIELDTESAASDIHGKIVYSGVTTMNFNTSISQVVSTLTQQMDYDRTVIKSLMNRTNTLETKPAIDTEDKTTIGYQWRYYYIDGNDPKQIEYNLTHESVSLEDTLLQFMNDVLTTLADIFNGKSITTFIRNPITK